MIRTICVLIIATMISACEPLDLVFAERSTGTVIEVVVEDNGVCSVTYDMNGRQHVSVPRNLLAKETCATLRPGQTVPVFKKQVFRGYPDVHWDALS